jgi:competence protein ComEA
MFKKLLLVVAMLVGMMGAAFAQVDVNKADQAALDGVKGIGPKTSKAILDERKKGGDFKDWADLEKRVKGIGGKSADKLSASGLTVNGQARPKSSGAMKDDKKDKAKADAGKDTKAADVKKEDVKKDMKKEEPKK